MVVQLQIALAGSDVLYRVTNIMLLHIVEHIESEELERQVVQIMRLVGVREGTVVLPGFTRDDVDQLLDVLCCD